MKILWFTWKDQKNPLAGGAEMVNEEIAKRLTADGHEVIFLVAGYKSSKPEDTVNNYKIVRLGNRWTVYWKAFRYYKKNLQQWPDLVIDEVNTIPFFAKLYVKQPNMVFAYQLCREIWFYQILFPLSVIGYLLEPLYLRLLADRKVITESNSARDDLIKHGFNKEKISVITVGSDVKPLDSISSVDKYNQTTVLSVGAMRSMKRTLHIIRAFEIAKKTQPNLKLVIVGDNSGRYGAKVMRAVSRSKYVKDIIYKGMVSRAEKFELMKRCQVLLVTSVKEGWGLVVTEANSMGTPAVVYNVDGLRDSVKNGVTGLVTSENKPENLAKALCSLLGDENKYQEIRQAALESARTMTYDKCYTDFLKAIQP